MFKQRFWTALVLIPLVLGLLIKGNPWVLGGITVVFVLAAGWEWLRLIPVTGPVLQGLILGVLCGLFGLSLYVYSIWLTVGLLLWGLIFAAVLTYPKTQSAWGQRWIVGAACLVLLPLTGSTVVAIYHQPEGRALIIYLFALVWATDIGAYLVGKKWGAHKLIPQVSPGKTIEGVCGGIGLALFVAGLGLWWFAPQSYVAWFMLAAVIVLISILGDLLISMLKRRCQLKDTGTLFPGHGGVLDRMDSFIAAAPFFYAGLCLLPVGLG